MGGGGGGDGGGRLKHLGGVQGMWAGGGGGDLVPTMPGCVCPMVKDMGPFFASRE